MCGFVSTHARTHRHRLHHQEGATGATGAQDPRVRSFVLHLVVNERGAVRGARGVLYCARGAWMDPSLYRARVAALKILTSYTRLLPIGIT